MHSLPGRYIEVAMEIWASYDLLCQLTPPSVLDLHMPSEREVQTGVALGFFFLCVCLVLWGGVGWGASFWFGNVNRT